jgi:outer membrane protein assembly factor BamA
VTLPGGPAPLAGERPATAVSPPGVPSVAELEAHGALVGRIDVHVQNIFDLADPREDHRLYRLANHLHYRTRERTVRDQLLFASGEQVSAEHVAESERILRSRVYLNDAWIVPVAYDSARNVVDLAVTVRDVWTLNPDVSLGRSGGSNRSRVGIEEENLLGLGTKLSVSRSHDVDRTSTLFGYYDSNVRGSWWQLGLDYADNSDGKVKALSVTRPFYSLDTRQAGGVTAYDGSSIVSRYSRGRVIDQFQLLRNQAQAYLGGSHGLNAGWTQRWYAGVRYDESEFDRRPDLTLQPATLPADRKLIYPWFGWQMVEDRYVKTENLDLIGRTEDVYLGRSLYVELGYSAPPYGGMGRAWLAQAAALAGWQSGDRRYLLLSATLGGRLDDGAAHNVSLSAGGRYFERLTDHQLFYVSLSGTTSHRLDADQQLLLGGDNGLRGYPIRFQGGTSSALLTLEHRVYTDWFPFRLLRIAGAVFLDAGRTWGQDVVGAVPLGLLTDVGLGVRFGNVRSGLGNVLHVDLSYALDAPAGTKRVQVTVATQQRF